MSFVDEISVDSYISTLSFRRSDRRVSSRFVEISHEGCFVYRNHFLITLPSVNIDATWMAGKLGFENSSLNHVDVKREKKFYGE